MQCPSPGPFAMTVWRYGICCTSGGWHCRVVYHVALHQVSQALFLAVWLRWGLTVRLAEPTVTAVVSEAEARRLTTGSRVW